MRVFERAWRHFFGQPNIYTSLLIATVICAIAWAKIVFTPGFVMHGDITFPTNMQNYALNFMPLWNQHPSYSNLDELDRLAIMVPVLWISHVLHLGIGLYSRLFLFFIFLTGAYTIIIGKRQIESLYFPEIRDEGWLRVATDVLASVIFCFNPWALYRISAPFFSISYAMSPLVIAYQLRYLVSGSWRALLVATIAWTMASGSPQYTIFFGVMSLVLFVWMGSKNIRDWAMASLRFVVIILCYAAFNIYWIAPAFKLISLQTISPGYTLNWTDVETFSAQATFLNVISGTDFWVTWWTHNNPVAGGIFGIVSAVCRTFIFIAAMAVAVVYRRRAFVVFLAIAILLLVVLLEGAHGPFRALYHAIVFGVLPSGYGWIIRAPEKFGAFLWLFYTLLISIGAALWFAARPSRQRIAAALSVAAIAIAIAWGPLVYGTLLTSYVPVPVPESYNRLADRLDKDPGKVLVLADYEDNARWNSGDAIFTWAPQKMAGFVVARSIPAPSFGGYHFQNPFSFFYSYVKEGGPARMPAFAQLLGTRYVLLEHDIIGDTAWYRRWSDGLSRAGAKLVEKTPDFSMFSFSHVVTAEQRVGPYAVLAGDAWQADKLIDRFGTQIAKRNLIFLDQQLGQNLNLLSHSSLLLLDRETVADAVATTYPRSDYTALFPKVYDNNMSAGWAHFRLNNPDEENSAGWGDWQTRVLKMPKTWPLDLGLGIVSTVDPASELRVNVPLRFRDNDVYVRVFDFAGPLTPRLSITAGKQRTIFTGTASIATWHWIHAGRVKGTGAIDIAFTSLHGAPAVGAVLTVPHGDLEAKTRRLKTALGTRIVKVGNLRGLRSWPEVQFTGDIRQPEAPVSAEGSVFLNEDQDNFWRFSGDETLRPVPGWLYAAAFAPTHGSGNLYFIPQREFDRWWKVQLLILALVAAAVAVRGLLLVRAQQVYRATQKSA